MAKLSDAARGFFGAWGFAAWGFLCGAAWGFLCAASVSFHASSTSAQSWWSD